MKASILILTIDRYETTKSVFETNMERAKSSNIDKEVLVCDNGSTDRRVVDYFTGKTIYHRVNKTNEGVGKSLNQLYLRAQGDIICTIGNDIEMPDHWLAEAVEYLRVVKNVGILGYDWGHGSKPPNTFKHGVTAGWLTPILNRVFGSWVFKRELVEKIGFFYDDYGPYGIEDSDFNERVNRSGYNSLYHPTLKSRHLVQDVGEQTAYRKMKDESLTKNCSIFGERLKAWDTGSSYVDVLPPMREPL